LITFDPPLDQPIAWLADRDPAVASTVLCIGYSTHTPATGSAPDSIVLQVAAASGGEFVRVQQGEISDGLSGSLVLDLDTQRVCGMVKASRDPRAPRGGWIIPVSAIARSLPAIVERNMASHDLTSPWRQLATRRTEFALRLFGSSAPLRVPDPPRNAPPSWWLDPRHRATGFQFRPEMDGLLDWALDTAQETPVAKLVVGEGGAGKTRLAVELAMRLAARGWIAGLLTSDDVWRLEDIAKALPEILAYHHQVFLAIDYPEGLAVELTRFFGSLPGPEKGIVRVLLLARFGGWWKAVRPSSDIKYLIDRDPIHLTPLGADPDRSADWFGEALRDYGSGVLGTAARVSTPVPTELLHAARRQVSALKLHALALVSVLHARDHGALPAGQVAWADPLTTLLEHEGKHWREAARGQLSAADDYRFQSRILLTPTLLPAYRDVEAIAGISRIPGLADRYPGEPTEIAMLLQAMYPPDRTSSVSWWAPLPLDRLGETLLAEVFIDESDGHSAGDYVAAVIGAASTQQAVQGLTVMARLRADPGTSEVLATGLSRCLDTLAAADRCRLLPALILADRQVPPGWRSSDGHLARLSAPDALRMVQDLLRPPSHRALLETGLAMLDHAERILDSDEIRTANLPEWMRKIFLDLRALGIDPPAETVAHILAGALRAQLLLQLGRAGEAIGPAEDAASSVRAVLRASGSTEGARASSRAEVPRLLMGRDRIVYASGTSDVSEYLLFVLDIYAQTLATVGRLQDSAQVRQECAAMAERNAASGQPEAKRTAGNHLYRLAEVLLELDKAEQAESSARSAVQHVHDLHDPGPSAVALTLWARTLDRLGRSAEARGIASEALRKHRQLAEAIGSRVHLAAAAQAFEHLVPGSADADPVAELREEAFRDPVAIPPFIGAAMRQAGFLAGRGEVEAARSLLAEAVAQARRLAADDPDTYLQILAHVLGAGAELGCTPEPLRASAEAVEILRRLVDERSRADLVLDLALMSVMHNMRLRASGRDVEAMEGFEEAIGLLRPLLKHDRWRTASFLSTTLGLFSETARRHGDGEPAVAAAREAIRLDVTRTDDLRPTPTEELARHRRMLFLALAKLMGERAGQGVGTAVILAIATEICELARSFPSGELDDGEVAIFTRTLATIGLLLRDEGRAEDAVAPLDEAIEILRHRAGSHSAGESTSHLFAISAARISLFQVLQRHAETAHAMTEHLADFRRPVTSRVDERINCMLMATKIIDGLPRPEFAVQALELAVEISRTCHDWAARYPDGPAGVAASVLVLFKILREMVRGGMTAGWQRPAILEIADGVEFLVEQVPDLLETGHAHALAFGAGLLAGGDTTDSQDLDRALEMTIRASKVRRAIVAHGKSAHMMPEADSEGVRQIAETASLVTLGTLLSAKHRYQDAIQPLEQALGILLATGQGISADQARLLNMTLSLLYEAYTILKCDDARQSMIDALHASQVPESVTDERLAGTERPGDLLNALQAAEELIASDPEGAVAALQGILDATAGRQGEIAHAACRKMADALRKIGRWQEALRIANLQIGYGRAAGLGPWTRLYDRCKLLETRLQTGASDQEILSEAASLIAEAERLPNEAAGQEYADPDWIRELLQRISAMAALRLRQWPDALQFVQAEVKLMRDRGASASELADAEFNAYSALVALDRISEASELLNRCAIGFRNDSRETGPGLVVQARGELAALADDHVTAIRLQSEALELLYLSEDSVQIREAHSVMGMRLRDADQFSAGALAHDLAAAVLAEFLGQPADTDAITSGLLLRAGEHPMTADLLCAAVGEPHGVHLSELLERLSEKTLTGPDGMLARVIARARDSRKATFDEFARHRMEWDPVFAAIAVARLGNVATARAVQARLGQYSGDRSWSQFSTALAHVLRGRRDATRHVALDAVDRILLRRCLDALDGSVYIPLAMADAMPISGFLSTFLQAAMNNEPTTELGRGLEELAGIERWRPLVEPLKGILAGSRNLNMISGLDSGNKPIISTLLRNLDVPGA
jgi:tetratricopeptide (TPR) repeat protein